MWHIFCVRPLAAHGLISRGCLALFLLREDGAHTRHLTQLSLCVCVGADDGPGECRGAGRAFHVVYPLCLCVRAQVRFGRSREQAGRRLMPSGVFMLVVRGGLLYGALSVDGRRQPVAQPVRVVV